ncbi:hypothetical protein BDN70DRAFT_367633 [Pholiota conissans]|uniref:Uncharacterized protein n=1 Tax=Pholiota conissans TaxID=109636 RepID=A0A9P6D7T9_9AGAR|nr:hypothetical protein BDN70DRAFT_367633 [Pholiota conissans]
MHLVKEQTNLLDRFQTYMERSHLHLLDLLFDFSLHFSAPLMKLAMQHAGRWRRFSIFAFWVMSDLVFDCFQTLQAPNLQYFAIHPNAGASFGNAIVSAGPIPTTPTILMGSLRLTYMWFDISAIPQFIPTMINITTLRIEGSRYYTSPLNIYTAILSILAIPGLENLSIAGNITDFPPFSALEQSIKVPKLQHLQIIDSQACAQHLLLIDAPSLDTLVLEKGCITIEDPLILAHPFPALRCLVLVDVEASDRESGIALGIFTENIHELCVYSDGSQGHRILLDLIQGSDSTSSTDFGLWPKLREATFALVSPQSPTFYANLLRARPTDSPELALRIHQSLIDVWQELDPDSLKSIIQLARLIIPMDPSSPITAIKEGWRLGRGRFGEFLDTLDTFQIQTGSFFMDFNEPAWTDLESLSHSNGEPS